MDGNTNGNGNGHVFVLSPDNLRRDLLIFFLAIGMVILAQFWYDAIVQMYKTYMKRPIKWQDYLAASILSTLIFVILLFFFFKVTVSAII